MATAAEKVAERLRRAAEAAASGKAAEAAAYAQAAANIKGSGQAKVQDVANQYAAIAVQQVQQQVQQQAIQQAPPAPPPANQQQAQNQANSAYSTYTQALATAQALKADPTAKNQTAAQKSALDALNQAAKLSEEANKKLTGFYTEKPKETPKEEAKSQPQSLRAPAPSPVVEQKVQTVKAVNKDIINFQRDEVSESSISRLLFEQVGGIELINIVRRDTVEGQNPYYTLISNLSSIKKNFNPTTLISRQRVNETVFDNYTIDLNVKIPDQEYLNRYNLQSFYYIDTNGDLVIELDNLASDERIELEIAENGTINLVDEA